MAWWLECLAMALGDWGSIQVESYQRLKKWYLIPPCLTLSIIKYRSRVKLSNPGKGVAPSPTPWCSSYWKGSLQVTLDYCCQIYYTIIIFYICIFGPGDLGSIPGRVIPKTQKMVLDASLLNTQHYKVWIKGKVEPSREGVAPSPTSWCSSYRKGSLWVTLDYGRQLYLLYICIYILFYIFIQGHILLFV